jgi:hypothetical protein
MKSILSEAWKVTKFPSRQERIALGKLTGQNERQVQIWFQNMRIKVKNEWKAAA